MPATPNIVRAAGLAGFGALVRSLGGDPAALLGKVGLDLAAFDDPDRYLPYRNVLQVIEDASDALNAPDFGLRLADAQDLSFLGALWLAIQSANSVREGMAIAGRHIHFHSPGIAVEMRASGDPAVEHAELRFLMPDLPPLPQATEHAVSHMCKLVRVLSDGAMAPAAIHFRHQPQGGARAYRERLGQWPRFGSTFDGIAMEAVAWRQRQRRHNAQLQAFVERYLIGAAPPPHISLREQVLQTLRNQMRAGPVGLGHVARVLRLQPRALQRRLRAGGQTFEELKDAVRREFALQLLAQEGMALAQVAQLLDFADQSVLTRACQRWFHTTPLVIRRQARSNLVIAPDDRVQQTDAGREGA